MSTLQLDVTTVLNCVIMYKCKNYVLLKFLIFTITNLNVIFILIKNIVNAEKCTFQHYI